MSVERQRSLEERRRSSISAPQEKRRYLIGTERCGDLVVYVQGDLTQQDKRAIFLTVHDIACNHHTIDDFVNKPCMNDIKERSIFVHVELPGHEENANNLSPGSFPSLQTIAEELVTILDFLHVKIVIGFGEGAGANILARFALVHSSRVLGLILVNCTGSSTSFMESLKAKFVNWKTIEGTGVAQSAEEYLIMHKFGQLSEDEDVNKEVLAAEYTQRLSQSFTEGSINVQNIKQYAKAFMNRPELPLKLYKGDVLLITGLKSSYALDVEKLYKELDKKSATLLKIDRAGDVLTEAPAKVARSILLFCKGLGLLTSVTLPGVERQRAFSGCIFDGDNKPRFARGMSMEDYDKPNIRRFSRSNSKDGLPPIGK